MHLDREAKPLMDAWKIFLPLPKVLATMWADSFLSKSIVAFFGAVGGYLFPTQMAYTTCVGAAALIGVDTFTGWWAAYVSPKDPVTGLKKDPVSSAKMVRVITKIIGYGSCVIVASVSARSVPGTEHLQGALVAGVGFFVIVTEGISILENVRKMGLKAPPVLKEFLQQRLKGKSNSKEE